VRTGNLLYLAGTLPMKDGKVASLGKVGREVDLAQAAEAAQLCALNALANAKVALGSLDKVVRVVMVNGFVNGYRRTRGSRPRRRADPSRPSGSGP